MLFTCKSSPPVKSRGERVDLLSTVILQVVLEAKVPLSQSLVQKQLKNQKKKKIGAHLKRTRSLISDLSFLSIKGDGNKYVIKEREKKNKDAINTNIWVRKMNISVLNCGRRRDVSPRVVCNCKKHG